MTLDEDEVDILLIALIELKQNLREHPEQYQYLDTIDRVVGSLFNRISRLVKLKS